MSSLISGNSDQYRTSDRLAARARLASNHTVTDHPWAGWVAANLPFKTGDKILDVGCGPAWFWEHAGAAVPRGIDLTVCDLSQGMVDEAMQRCRNLPFAAVAGARADAMALPFQDQAFDGVIAMHMMYHVADPKKAIADMARVLKPGGFLAVTTNGIDNMRSLYELTAVFGGTPYDPAAEAFGFSDAEQLLDERFGNVQALVHPAHMRVTSPDDVFFALTSYPPGDQADEQQLANFKTAILAAFQKGGGAMNVEKQTGLFIAKKQS
jgi:SAM-dependent methyltransferase